MANFDTLNVVFGLLKMHVKNKFKEKVMGFIFSMCRELFFLFIFRISYFSRCSYVSLKKEPIIRVWVYNLWPVPSVGATSARGAPAAPLWRGYSQAPVCSNTSRGDNDLSHTQLNVEKELALVGSYHDIII